MNGIEIGIVATLVLGVVIAWYYAIVVVSNDSVEKSGVSSTASESFPVQEWEEIGRHELGQIEGNIKGLTQVIVAAHRVEEPLNALRAAVKKNLQDNVEYHFLVSKSHAKSELDGWVNMFLAIAHVVLKQAGSGIRARDLVRISTLDYDWRDTPYVFYRAKADNGQVSTIAFRGNQTDEGIAEKYVRLPGWLAYSMALAILSDAPQPMTVTEDAFRVPPEVDANALAGKAARQGAT